LNNPTDDCLTLSVVVLNFNGFDFLKACIDSLYENIDVSFEIIFVDNQSSDDSVNYIESNYPLVNVIVSPENGGFARGNNLGVSKAQGKYLLILNNDTILKSPISIGLNVLEKEPSIGVVGAKMTDISGAYRSSAFRFPGIIGAISFSHNFIPRSFFQGGEALHGLPSYYQVDWVEASFSLVRRCDFFSIGGYCTDYFMYSEDVDFCYRMMEQGLTTVYMPGIQYVHFGGFSLARYDLLVIGFNKFFIRNYSKFYGSACIMALAFGLSLKVLMFSLAGFLSRKISFKKLSAIYLKALKEINWA
jgi:GT2 family glycosyltransferase